MKTIKRIIYLTLLNSFCLYTLFCGNLDLYNYYNYSTSELFRQNYLQTNYINQVSLNYFSPNYGYISTLATFNQYNLPLSFEFGYKKLSWQNFGWERLGFDYSNFVFDSVQKVFQEGTIVTLPGVRTNLSGVGEYSTNIFAYVSPRVSIGYAASDNIKPAFWGYDFVNKTYQGFTLPTGSSLWRANFTSLGGQVEFFASVSQNLYNLGQQVDLKKLVELPKVENLSSSVSLPKSEYQPIHIAGSDTFFPRLTQLFPQQVQQSNVGRFVSSLKTDSFNALYQPGLTLHERGNLVENAVSKLNYTTAPNFYVREYSPQKGAIEGIERKIGRETESVFETTSRFMSQPGDLPYKPEELKGNVLAYKQYISPQGQVYSVVTAKEKDKATTAVVDSQKGWTKETVGYQPEQSQVTSVSQRAKFLEKNYAEIQKMENERVLMQKEIDKKMQSAVPYSDSYTVGKSVASVNSLGTSPLPDTTFQKVKFAGLEERTDRLDLETQKAQLLLAKSLVYDDKSVKKLGLGDYISIKVTPDDMIKFSQFYLSKAEAAYKKDYFTYALANLQLATRYIPFLGHLDNMAMIQAEKTAVEKFSGTPLERSFLGTKLLYGRLTSGVIFQAIDSAMYLPTYAIEYQLSLGIAGKILGSGFVLSEELQGAKLLNTLLTKHSITSAVMLGVNLPFTAENMMQASIPEYSITREGTLFITRHPSTLEIIGKGFVNAWAEMWTEQAGGLLGDLSKFGFTPIGKLFNLPFLQGLPGEVFEEQVNTAINLATNLAFTGPKKGWVSDFIQQEVQTTITSALSFAPYQVASSISSIGRGNLKTQVVSGGQLQSDIKQPPQSGLGYTATQASRVMDVLQILKNRGVEGVKLTPLGETNILPDKPIIDVKADVDKVNQALAGYPRVQRLVTNFLSDYQQYNVLLFSQGKFWQFNQPNLLQALPHEAFEFKFYDVLQNRELSHQLSNLFVNYYTPQLPNFVSSYENNIPQFKPEFSKLVSDTVSKFRTDYTQPTLTIEIPNIQLSPAVTFARGMNRQQSEVDKLMSRLSTGDEIAFVMPAEKVGEFRNEINKFPVHMVVGYYDVKHPIFPWVKTKYAQVLVDLKGMGEINKALGEAGGNEYIRGVTNIAEKYGGDTVLVGIQSIKRYIATQILQGLEQAKKGSGFEDVGDLNLSGKRARFYEQWYLGNRLPNRLQTVRYFDTKGTMSRSVFVDFLEGKRSLNEIDANRFLVRKVDSIGVVDKNSGKQVYFEFEYYDSKGNKIDRPVKLLNEYGSNIGNSHLGDVIINHVTNIVKENQKKALIGGINVREMEGELARRIQNEFKKNNINTKDLGFDISKVKIKMVCVDSIEQGRTFLQYYDDFIRKAPYGYSKFSVDENELEKIAKKHINDIDNLIEKFSEKGYDTSFLEEQRKKHLEFLAVKGVAEGWEAAYEPIYGQTFDQSYRQHQSRHSRHVSAFQSQSQVKNLGSFNELKELLDVAQSGSGEGGLVSPAQIYTLKNKIRAYNIFASKKGQPIINSIQDAVELWLKDAHSCPHSLFIPGTNNINPAIADYLPDKVTDDIISYFVNETNKEAKNYENLLTVEDQKLYNIYGVDYIAALIDAQTEKKAIELYIKAQDSYLEKRIVPSIAKFYKKLGLTEQSTNLENKAISEKYVDGGYGDYARTLFLRNENFVQFLIYTNQVDVAEKFLFDLFDGVFKGYKTAKSAVDKGDIAKLRKMLDKDYKDLSKAEEGIKKHEEEISSERPSTEGYVLSEANRRKAQERIRAVRNMYDGALCGCSLSPQVLATLPEGVDMYKEFLDWNLRETFGQTFSRDAGAEAEGVRGFRETVHGDRNQLSASGVQKVLSNRESVESGFSKTDISRGGVEGSGETVDGRSDKGRGTWGQDSNSKDTLLSRKVSGDTVREIYREFRGKGLKEDLEHSAQTSLLSYAIAKPLLSNLPERYSFLAEDLFIASLLHDYDFTLQRGEKGPPRVNGVPLEMSSFFDKIGITSPLEQQVIAALIFRTDALFDEEAKRNYVILFNDIKQVDSELADWVDRFAEIVDYASQNADYYFAHSVRDVVDSVKSLSSEIGVDETDLLASLPVFLEDNAINHRLYNNVKGTILAKNLEHNFKDLQKYVKNLEVSPAESKKELAQTYIQKKDKLLPDIDLLKLYADDVVDRIFTKKQNIKNLLDDYEETVRRIVDELRGKTVKTFQKLKETAQTEVGRSASVSGVSGVDVHEVLEETTHDETLRGLGDKKDVKVSDTVRSGTVEDNVSVGRRGESVGDVSRDAASFSRRARGQISNSGRLPAGSLFEDLAVYIKAIEDLDFSCQKSGWAKNRVKLEGVEEKFDQINKVIQRGDYLLFDALADYINAHAVVTFGFPVDRFNKSLAIEKLRELYFVSKRDIIVFYNAVEKMLSAPVILRDLYNKELAQTYIEEKEKTVSVVPLEGSYVVIDNLKVNLQEVLRGDWKEDFAKDDVKKVLSGIYHAVGNLRDVNLKITVPLEVYSDVHSWLGFDFSKLAADSQADPDLVLLSYGIQSLVKTNNIDIKVIPQVSIEDLTELPQVVSNVEVKQEVVKSEQQQEPQEVRAPPVEVKEQAKVGSSPKQTSQLLEIPDDRILTLDEAKEIIRSHSELKSALVDIRPISPYHQKILLREPSGNVVTYDMYCGKYGLSIYYKGQNVLKTNLGYVYGDKLKELFKPQLELREKNLEAVKQQTLRTQTQEIQREQQAQQVTEQEVAGEQEKQPELRPYPVVRVAANFGKDYNTVRNADVVVARDNFEDQITSLYHRFGQGKYTLTDSVVGAYAEFYKQIPYYYDDDVKIDLPEPPRFNTEWETFYTSLMNSFALFPEGLCDKFISWYGAYLTGEIGQYGVKNAVELTQYITPLEKVTIDDLLPHLSNPAKSGINPLNVNLPRDNTADRLRNIYEWLMRSGYEVGVFAVFDREYGEIQDVKFVRFVVLPKDQAGDISKYAEFSAKNLAALKIPYFDIPLGSNVLETETQAKYPSGYVAIKQKGNDFKLMPLREYLLSFVEGKVAEITNKQDIDLKEWAKDVRKNINYRLQQTTVYKDPIEAYKNTVVPWNMYRVVVLDENGVPISEYSNRYIDLVKLYTACLYSLREQGYDVEVYKPDNGVLTLVPNSSLVFADPGKKHNFSRLNNIASSLKTPPMVVLPVSQVSNDFGSNVFFVVADQYDDSLNILCDGGAWLNQNSALGKAEFYVPVKYTIELTPGVNQVIPNKIFEFISLKKELEHATSTRRDVILEQLKNFAIDPAICGTGRIIIGDKVVNANKMYITDVSVIGGEDFGVNLIISGNIALPSSEVSFNLGYGGAKYVPEVVVLGRSDIDLVCSLKQGDERWVEIALNAAFTRLKEMSRKDAPLTNTQRQQLEQILAKVKSAGIEVLQTADGVVYQFRANNLDNNKVNSYRKIIDSTDKLAKKVFGEGLVRTIKIRKNGHEYVFKGYYVLGYPTATSAVYRYPISNGRLDAKFFEYISAKYGADVAVELMKYLDSANKTTALSCYQALYSAFVDENAGSNFENYKVEEEYLQQALKDNKIAQEIIRELLYTTPKKVALPEGIYLAGKEQKYVFFPSLNRRFIDKPYKFFNDLEKSAFAVLLSPTQENVENYYRVLEEKTFTKDGLLSEIFEVHNDAVLNLGLVVPRGGQGYTTAEISREVLLKFGGGEKLLNKLAKGEKVYAVVLRHPLISPDTLAVVELKLSNDNTPLKIHPVLWSVLKGDFDKDSAVLVTSDDMQKLLSSMYRQQQVLGTAKLDKQIEEKRASLAEDYTHKDTLNEAFEKVRKTDKDTTYDVAGVIGGSLRILTGNIHWSMYELREFVRAQYETCDLTPQDYLKYAEILWKIEQQPISGKKVADLFTNEESDILNNPDVPIDTKLKIIETAFARNGLDVVIDLSRWNRARTVSPVRLGHLLKWQDFVSKSARLTSQDIDEFIMLTNLYFGQRRMGLSRYREGLVTEMTRAELLDNVPAGWHMVNTLSNRHPYSYWERIACDKLGIEFAPLPGEAVVVSGQSGEEIQGEERKVIRSVPEQTIGQADIRARYKENTPSTTPSNATGKEVVVIQPAQQETETKRVEKDVNSPAEDTLITKKPTVDDTQKHYASRGTFVHHGFPGNLNRGVVIVGDISEARKYKEFVYTPKEIRRIVNEFNKKGVINGDRARYVVDKLAYFDSNTGRYSKIPSQVDYSQFVICVSNFDGALKLVRDYKMPVLAIDSSYVKFNERGFLKTMQNSIDAGVKDVYVYSPRIRGEDVVGSIVATLMGRVDLAVKEFKSPWVKVPYSGYITEERIQQELTELNKKTLRNRIITGITAGAITVGSYLGIDYFKKYQDIAAKTPPKVEVVVDQSPAKVADKVENIARRGWETLRAEGRLPVNIAYDDLVGVKLAAYRAYFEKGLKQHLGVQNEITLRDLEGLSFDEVKVISLKAAKEALGATGKVIVASEETEKSVPQAQQTQQTQQTAQQETQKTVVSLPVVNQTKPPVIDGITIRSISVKRGDPTAVFVNFNNGLFIKCRAVQEGDNIRLIPTGLQANSKFMDFVTAWYTDWLKNSYDPQRGNGGYEEFTIESIDLVPEVDVVRQRNGKYIVSVFFGDALWFEKEIDVGPRGGISGLEALPKNLRDEVRKQVREILNLPEPPAGPPIGGGLSMNLFKQLVDKANQGDERARRVLEFYKKDFPELYYKQAQRNRMYEPKYGNKDKIVYIIVSNRPQVGKSMVGNIIAGKVGGRYIATSDILVEKLAQKLGIKPEDIKRARAKNPEAYRKELIQLGDNLTRKWVNLKGEVMYIPTTPGEEALRKAKDEGANIIVIDGIRRRSELRKVILDAYGYKCVEIGVFGYSESIDNTEPGLLYDCDYVIFSRGIQSKNEVVQEIDNILSDVQEIPQHWVQKYKNTKEFVVVDLETTGLSNDSQIIQIAVLKCKKQGRGVSVTDKYVTRVKLVNTNLDRDTVEEVKRITGIDLTETANEGKDVKHVLVEIEKYLLNYPVVMHNAAFDLEVLNYWRQKYGMLPFTPKVLFDTKALAKYLYPASETHLETLAMKYGVEHTKLHDAENDALVTAKVFKAMFSGESKEIKEAKQKLEKYRREQLDGLMKRLGYEKGFSEEFVQRLLSDIRVRQS